MSTVLTAGTRIICIFVDRYGFLGRDHHPRTTDIGKSGTVVSHEVEDCSDDDVQDQMIFYTCDMDDGSTLELADFEIKAA